jgi:hypothetical protein
MGRSQRMSAGTSIFVDRSLAPLISANGILLEGRAQFITLHILGTGTLTIINVYASCSSNERALMWKRLNEANLVADHFILGGDSTTGKKLSEEGWLANVGCIEGRRLHGTT